MKKLCKNDYKVRRECGLLKKETKKKKEEFL